MITKEYVERLFKEDFVDLFHPIFEGDPTHLAQIADELEDPYPKMRVLEGILANNPHDETTAVFGAKYFDAINDYDSYLRHQINRYLDNDEVDFVTVSAEGATEEKARRNILDELIKREFYEHAYRLNPGATHESFAAADPVEALMTAQYHNDKRLWNLAMEEIIVLAIERQEPTLLQAYSRLADASRSATDPEEKQSLEAAFEQYKTQLEDSAYYIDDGYSYFIELYEKAKEVQDTATMKLLTHRLFESDPDEAVMMESEYGGIELAKQYLGIAAEDDEEIAIYVTMIANAKQWAQKIEEHFGIDLPEHIGIGDLKGNYAEIKNKLFKGRYNAINTKPAA